MAGAFFDEKDLIMYQNAQVEDEKCGLGWTKCLEKIEFEKIFKKSEKTSKKVLTNGYGCDILHERSKRECKKQRSLKIEQQIERTK